MAYWGNEAPVIYYGTAYGSSWDLAEEDCNFEYSWLKDRVFHTSVITGKVSVYEKASSANYGRMQAEIVIYNLDRDSMNIFKALRDQETLKLCIHGDVTGTNGWDVIFVVEKYQSFATGESGLPYPQYDSVYLKLISQDYIDLKNIALTT